MGYGFVFTTAEVPKGDCTRSLQGFEEGYLMAFNITEFSGALARSGVAKSSHYSVRINLPSAAAQRFNEGVEDLTLRAEAVGLPGRTVQAITYRDYGAPREIGYSTLYTPVSITFLLSEDLRERAIFTNWQDTIVGDHRTANYADGKSFNARYYSSYTGSTIEIVKYDQTGKEQLKTKLVEAYPRTINEMSMSYGSDEVMRLNVSFQYRYFTENY